MSMEQTSAPATGSNGRIIITILAWIGGIMSILMGIGYLFSYAVLGILIILFGLFLLPVVRSAISSIFGIALTRGRSILIALGLFMTSGIVASIHTKHQIKQIREREQREQAITDSLQEIRAEEEAIARQAEAERQQAEDEFIAQYPYVDRAEYRIWVEKSPDGIDRSGRKFARFLTDQRVKENNRRREAARVVAQQQREARREARAVAARSTAISTSAENSSRSLSGYSRRSSPSTYSSSSYSGSRSYSSGGGGRRGGRRR